MCATVTFISFLTSSKTIYNTIMFVYEKILLRVSWDSYIGIGGNNHWISDSLGYRLFFNIYTYEYTRCDRWEWILLFRFFVLLLYSYFTRANKRSTRETCVYINAIGRDGSRFFSCGIRKWNSIYIYTHT